MNKMVVSNQDKSSQIKLSGLQVSNYSFSKLGPAGIKQLSDKELYEYCRTAGLSARHWARRFVAALPEVARRHLYLKYKFRSIHEFASKMAGFSHKMVNETLRINEKFKDFPKMKELIGEVGISKLKVVACIITTQTEQFWAAKVVDMSRPALEVLVREIRKNEEERIIDENSSSSNSAEGASNIQTLENQENNPQICPKFPWEPENKERENENEDEKEGMAIFRKAQTNEQTGMFEKEFQDAEIVKDRFSQKNKKAFVIHIDDDTEFRLRKFKLNLEKEKKQVLDWNKTLKEMVERAEK